MPQTTTGMPQDNHLHFGFCSVLHAVPYINKAPQINDLTLHDKIFSLSS